MSQLEALKMVVGDVSTLEAPLSPATLIDVVTGSDDEGWPTYTTVAVGEHIISNSYRWQVVGFLTNDQIVVTPADLRLDTELVRSAIFNVSADLVIEERQVTYEATHRTGLVSFEWADL